MVEPIVGLPVGQATDQCLFPALSGRCRGPPNGLGDGGDGAPRAQPRTMLLDIPMVARCRTNNKGLRPPFAPWVCQGLTTGRKEARQASGPEELVQVRAIKVVRRKAAVCSAARSSNSAGSWRSRAMHASRQGIKSGAGPTMKPRHLPRQRSGNPSMPGPPPSTRGASGPSKRARAARRRAS